MWGVCGCGGWFGEFFVWEVGICPFLSSQQTATPFNTHTTEANSKKKREGGLEDTVLPPALSLEIAGSQLKPLGRTEDKIYTKIKA